MSISATLLLVAVLAGSEPTRDDHVAVQGIWRGTGRNERFTLVFCGDVLIGMVGNHPLLGAKESGFRLADGEIDFDRIDGLQRGRYVLEGDQLTLLLSDVNLPRPESLDVAQPQQGVARHDRAKRDPPTQHRYLFERAH
jgi:hypothetical protein